MTDKDKAIALGNCIIAQMQKIAALENCITEYCLSDSHRAQIDWRKTVKDYYKDDGVQKAAAAWLSALRFAIDAETQDSSLIDVLHREFLKVNPLEEE